jgi:hypothetical protein
MDVLTVTVPAMEYKQQYAFILPETYAATKIYINNSFIWKILSRELELLIFSFQFFYIVTLMYRTALLILQN